MYSNILCHFPCKSFSTSIDALICLQSSVRTGFQNGGLLPRRQQRHSKLNLHSANCACSKRNINSFVLACNRTLAVLARIAMSLTVACFRRFAITTLQLSSFPFKPLTNSTRCVFLVVRDEFDGTSWVTLSSSFGLESVILGLCATLPPALISKGDEMLRSPRFLHLTS